MTTPRIEVDLSKIRHNTRCLVERLKSQGISVTAVTKAVCGHPKIAQAMLDGGAVDLGEARVSNVERLRKAGITGPIALIRTPMLSQVDQVVRSCDNSYNTEIEVIARLAEAAHKTKSVHSIILMVEMGDMRDGIMPENIEAIARQVNRIPGVALKGIGANFACLSGVVPDAAKMATFSTIASEIEGACGPYIETVSGGNSANLPWALGHLPKGCINNLRLGEAILLGVEPVSGNQIDGLYTDAFTLIAEVIEAKVKTAPTSVSFTDPALAALRLVPDNIQSVRSIIAIGEQDTDISGLTLPKGVTCLGATSDHMVVQTIRSHARVGSELKLQMNYSALMRAMAAPDIINVIIGETLPWKPNSASRDDPRLALV
ncbi:MAG: amino-acid racemase [Blastopirellula sp.]|nr:MAG: amino-acid racemase [Blastopirellula sp.]